ncbi:hypothetical protein EV200_104303 [Pedobacter psychrotolerans]|uniref:Beta/gamma crystallin n=1 Tax=Pedobacter psychrotolerans TaxID=1843235 RepID=A0A4R2HC40_9SPHI|nr:hypothetical protein [Pedobacter psychrotolerans]TCO25266.1 hypothetical protein EV200_104303 [Pedobacter psychrotolerans]GGE46850.1 hypothetical protein GCM10011413_11160 [Pedobacter psychrotolerans]
MKKLFFALICTAICFSASANDLTPKRESPTEAKVETLKKSGEVKTIIVEQAGKEVSNLFRRQMNFTFTDACGTQTTIYVSGASSASNHSLWQFAWDHFKDNLITGCFWVG